MEEWKDIKGYEGMYQVSNTGLVRSLQRYVNHKIYGKMLVKEKILKNQYEGGSTGYISVGLADKNNKTKRHRIHRLLAINWIPNPFNLPEVNHINGDRKDYTLSNLEWCSKSQNIKHSYDKLNHKRICFNGEKNGSHKITEDQAIEIYNLKGKYSQVEIGRMYNISNNIVHRIHKKKNWKYLWN